MPLNLIFIQPGNYTIEDNGIPGDNISVIKDGSGVVIFTFGHPADGLGFTVSTTGVNITVNFTDSMNAANFTIGNLTNLAESPNSVLFRNIVTTGTVTLVSNTTIAELGNDAAADITAGAIILSAVSGIGAPGNAIETRTGLFEAETTTGGIAISNFGSMQIGGISADVDGLDVATSGDISLINTGSIFLTESNTVTAGEVVHGGGTSGNVVLTALGANSDIIGNVDNGAVTVPRGSATLTAGRDIQLGTIGSDFNNDIITNAALTLTAGRDILIDGFADILSDNFGLDTGANLTFTAGRNIGILNLAGTSASVTASGSGGGDALITTGVGGALTVNGPGSFGLGSTSGEVVVNADRILIDGGSGISAPSGVVTIRPATPGREMLLGSAADASDAIEISNTEINRIFTPNLSLGGTTAGLMRVIAPITINSPGTAPLVTMRSQDDIQFEASFSVVTSLAVQAGNNIFQTAGTITAPTFVATVDVAGDDGGFGGAGTFLGTITASSLPSLVGGVDGDILNGTAAAEILIGGGGIDVMKGGGGNDRYYVDNSSDVVNEVAAQGNDLVLTSVNYLLASGQSIESLGTTDMTGTAALILVGNEIANIIVGNAGANTLDGGGGVDVMQGLGGNDRYYVDSASDQVLETAGQGNDLVLTSVDYVLGAAADVESIGTTDMTGVAGIDITGNGLANIIVGNAGANILDGAGGVDIMQGLGGDDRYFIDVAGDQVIEAAAGGNDILLTSVSYTLSPTSEVESLSTRNQAGVEAINITANDIANVVVGNAGVNVLLGLGGNDIIDGLGGADLIYGSLGNDQLIGNGGADQLVFDSPLNAATNVDSLIGFAPVDDTIVLDRTVFSGILANGTLAASAFVTGAAAGDADDRIVYNSGTGQIFYDADGSGAGAQILFATVTAGTLLTNADFVAIA